ncbi:hypothetical protein S40288_02383 [Stachybotrys chartarum IBT 40288]|nr:hypothetical protein S40288_02383 [Stachybotrys chartarum IBT 40288]
MKRFINIRQPLRNTKSSLSRIIHKIRLCRPGHPNGRCRLINLPADVVAVIITRLPPQSRLTLSLTCKTLHRIVHCCPGASLWMSKSQHLEYLCSISRGMSDVWVCEVCRELHSTKGKGSWSCPKENIFQNNLISATFAGSRMLPPSVVQMSVKWDRLGLLAEKGPKYLAAVLRPRRRTVMHHNDQMPDTESTTTFCSKIVDGRFLHKTVMEYGGEFQNASEAALEKLWVCVHQWILKSSTEPLPEGHPNRRYWNALVNSYREEGLEVCGSCPACPTDFAVVKTHVGLVVKVWADFGAGETPIDPLWKLRVNPRRMPSSNIQFWTRCSSSNPCRIAAEAGATVIIGSDNMPYDLGSLGSSIPGTDRGIFHVGDAEYWHFAGITLAKGPYGVYVYNSNNCRFERLTTHNNYETGFHM